MADRPEGYGLTAELAEKMKEKYDVALEQEARHWIEAVTGEAMVVGVADTEPLGPERLHEALKNGVILCNLMNKLSPGSIGKVNSSKMAFKMMENISNFLTASERYGVAPTDSFQTVDLYEAQNMWQVVCGLHALGRAAQRRGYTGPQLGVKESEQHKRNFSEEQLQKGKGIIGLQAGSNKGATQSGMGYGRDINSHSK